jgi:hypothetical protein
MRYFRWPLFGLRTWGLALDAMYSRSGAASRYSFAGKTSSNLSSCDRNIEFPPNHIRDNDVTRIPRSPLGDERSNASHDLRGADRRADFTEFSVIGHDVIPFGYVDTMLSARLTKTRFLRKNDDFAVRPEESFFFP